MMRNLNSGTLIPMSGVSIDTANPLRALANGIQEKTRYDQEMAISQEKETYNRQQDAIKNARQERLDGSLMASRAADDELTREKLVKAQYETLGAREQNRIRSVAVAAAQAKGFLDRDDVEGALAFASDRQLRLREREAAGENIDDSDTAAFIEMLKSGDVDTAKNYVNAMVQTGQMLKILEMPKQGVVNSGGPTGGTGNVIDQLTGATYTAPRKLSALEQKEFYEAADIEQSGKAALTNLAEALNINDKAYSGAMADQRAWATSNLGNLFNVDTPNADATVNMRNLTVTQALETMKAIFGANPTNSEREVLLDIQASTDKTPEQRKLILDRALRVLNSKVQSAAEKKSGIVTGSIYGDSVSGQPIAPTGGKVPVINRQTGESFDIDQSDLAEVMKEGFEVVR
jgi:hypothetical protein